MTTIKLNKSEKKILDIWLSIITDTGMLSPSEILDIMSKFCHRILQEFRIYKYLSETKRNNAIKEHQKLLDLKIGNPRTMKDFIKNYDKDNL